MDMFDRFMDSRSNVQKSQLQLLGVTCLFIAAKIEVSEPCLEQEYSETSDKGHSESGQTSEQRTNQKYSSILSLEWVPVSLEAIFLFSRKFTLPRLLILRM